MKYSQRLDVPYRGQIVRVVDTRPNDAYSRKYRTCRLYDGIGGNLPISRTYAAELLATRHYTREQPR